MTFTEKPFWILTAIVFALWLVCRSNYRARLWLLLIASIVFYGYHAWQLLPLLFAYCLVDWGAACWIVRSRRPKLVLGMGVGFNLAVLCFWKYTPLILHTLGSLTATQDLCILSLPANWIIPFGISFYAFTGIAYMTDVYWRRTPAETNFFRYALSAIFFPHLVAGPILRPNEFLTRLTPETMPDRSEAPLEAVHLLARGFFKKMVLADRIALAVDPFFVHVADSSTTGVWSLPYVYLYAFQIYFDFSGYTDIARGLGLLFGFRWPDNFNLPYLATSIQDFWRRWHITLSLFLRDYLYYPLGGNRHGRFRTYLNLMLTMVLGGLWHGASWSFMWWGGLHGIFLIVNRLWSGNLLRERLAKLRGVRGVCWQLICIALTFHSACLAWCFFRLNILGDSLACLRKVVLFDADKTFVGGSSDLSLWLLLGVYGAAVGAAHWIKLPSGVRAEPAYSTVAYGFQWAFGVTLLALAVLLSPGGNAPLFIYFQF
jgi:alginate O-acetyltransferase complex protein AlgI